MDEPIKVIWKYKNNNRRTQYNQYIFIGDVPKNVLKVLEIIEKLSFYDSLITLTKDDYKILEKKYGEQWYKFFFNTYHLNSSIYVIRESTVQKNELTEKYGQEWVQKHIMSQLSLEKKLIYSFESLIRDDLERKTKKKKESALNIELDEEKDFTTSKKINIEKIFKKKLENTESFSFGTMKGGFNDEDEVISGTNDDNQPLDDRDDGDDEDNEDNENKLEETEIDAGELLEEEIVDLEAIEQLYKDADTVHDQESSKTTALIKKALDDNKIFDKKINEMIHFDTSKSENIYDENIKDIVNKIYVKINYLYKDDTIKMIKDKICCSLRNNDSFGEHSYILPSRQYLWGEYYFNNNIEKIMLGQKWLRRNEILNIDIEPNNNLRLYEDLEGQLKALRDNIKRYTSKIRREDDETNILYDYVDYISNNEIFMMDIYNEFGTKYNPNNEAVKNLMDVYLRIYFPKIRNDEVKNIIDYLNNDKKIEENRMQIIFETINNDLIIENEIMTEVGKAELDSSYKKLFKDTFILQSIIHVKLRLKEGIKIDLYRIFNEFTVSKEFPFVVYQTVDGNIVYKFHEDEINKYMQKPENTDLLTKWFENTPYGLTFKFPINDKFGERFLSVTVSENGRLDYKIVWKEDDGATINDIKLTYPQIIKLITKINSEKNRQRYYIPEDNEFVYAFINTSQKFELPEKYNINHNDISDFARFFYPYIAVCIEPRKRQAKGEKLEETSKFGTYLRYKRVSKYDNQTRIEMRILHLIRNYESTDKVLAIEISKQFNITEEKATEEIERVKNRYPNIKKSRRILKKLENLPKYKSPGIGIDIQGKQRDKYKIRISGARNKEQLDRITKFMSILLYLYIETYLYKKPERQKLKEKLKLLTNIAKRRNKVMDLVQESEDGKEIKKMAKLDKQRIGYKPEEGQSQWSRCCQNSGDGKRRRPIQYTAENMAELIKNGYKLNKKTSEYEKRVMVKNDKSGKKEEIVLKSLKFAQFNTDGEPTGNEIHYTCDPEINGEHFYVGFLTRCRNPYGHCMPCCFKKDPAQSKNESRQSFYAQCTGAEGDKKEEDKGPIETSQMEKLYILQDTNKIQEGRFGLLPKYIDFFFNIINSRDKFIKQHYLTKTTENGFFFKYGSIQTIYPFLNAISTCLDMSVDMIIAKILDTLDKDRSEQIYTSLNNGDIKTQFGDKENFIKFVKNNISLDYDLLNNLLSIPKVLTNGGLNIIMFQKKSIIIKKTFEKEKVREDFNILCQNIEDIYSLISSDRQNIFIVKEGKHYYPIVLVNKKNETDKNIDITKTFQYKNDKTNIVKQISDFYSHNCKGSFIDNIIYKDSAPIANEIYHYLRDIKSKDFSIKYQVIDSRNKTKFIVCENNTLIPVRPSGALYNVQIVKAIDKYILPFTQTYKFTKELFELSKETIPIKPVGVYYDKMENNSYFINALVTITNDAIPVEEIKMTKAEIEKLGLFIENHPIIDKIDNEIIKRKLNLKADKRVMDVNMDEFLNESYELFRLEFSSYLNKLENNSLKEKITKIINSPKLSYEEKVDNIRLILYKLVDKDLYQKYKKIVDKKGVQEDELAVIEVDDKAAEDEEEEKYTNQLADIKGGKYDKLLHISKQLPDVKNYEINNDRASCANNKEKDMCNDNIHCHWTKTGCYMSITLNEIIKFINRMSEELATNDRKAYEILRIGDYFVSDIVDYNRYTERPEQTVVRSSGSNVKKILSDIFGKENIPIIGKKKLGKLVDANYQQINEEYPLQDMKEYYVQKIIHNNMSFYRAYVNSFYWLQNEYNDNDSRNLGYYSPLQSELSSYFRGNVIDFISNNDNKKVIDKELSEHIHIKKKANYIKNYIIKVISDNNTITDGFVELFIMSILNPTIPIVIYNDSNKVMIVFDNGKVVENLDKYKNKNNTINIRLTYYLNDPKIGELKYVPDVIEVIFFNN
jgi:hypothetical protein